MSVNWRTRIRFVGQAAVWGTSFLLIKVALHGFAPYYLVLARVSVAALLLWTIARRRGATPARGTRAWALIVISAMLSIVAPYWLLSAGETHTGAGTAGALIGATPLLTLALAAATSSGRTRVAAHRVVGFALGFAGLLLILQPWRSSSSAWGVWACLAASASYAAGYVFADRAMAGGPTSEVTPIGLAASQLIAADGVLLTAAPFVGPMHHLPNLSAAAAVIVLGVGASGVATLWYFQLVADLGAADAAAVDYLVPVFAVLTGAVALGESVPPSLFVGGAVLLAGLAIAEGRLHPRRHATVPECSA